MFIPHPDHLRRCVVACFQQCPLWERPPVEEIHTVFLLAENSRHFQRGVAAKAGSARFRSMQLRRSLLVMAFLRLRLKIARMNESNVYTIATHKQAFYAEGKDNRRASIVCGRSSGQIEFNCIICNGL
jgi:hypothetical protein